MILPDKITQTQTSHATAYTHTVTVTRKFDYDHAGRLINTWHQVNNGAFVLLTRNVYNELGQLISKKLHSTDNGINFKQHVDYRYNIRGWITRINNADLSANNPDNENEPPDYFGIDLLYHQQDPALGNKTFYDGNIGALRWSKCLGLGAHELDEPTGQASTFSYDVMGRLTATNTFFKKAQWHPDPSRRETGLAYDRNGNINKLTRWSVEGNVQDDLSYTYHGNQLLDVTDASSSKEGFNDIHSTGSDYVYDAAGNLVTDHNKGITSIQYNHLNLPQVVQNIDGEKLLFTYDAAGIKLGQQWYNAAGVLQLMYDYNGEFMYEGGTLQFINHEQGRVNMTGEVPVYEYTLRDHQGNTRITFTTQPRTDTWKATMEAAGDEQNDFGNYHADANDLLDHTDAGTVYQHAHILNGGYRGQVGMTRSLAVLPGDTVRASVYAKYEDQVQQAPTCRPSRPRSPVRSVSPPTCRAKRAWPSTHSTTSAPSWPPASATMTTRRRKDF
ncbi:MAG: hypothetical protein HC859_01945 [Bacteroidia bacterium]|nr:hypothetical protein [Bacteroidia bacterium]